jgi:RNA polymerase sigma-70 factor (ECF subfamily)
VQDAFTAAYREWDAVARMDRPDAWVRRVLVNKSTSKFRRLGAEARALTRLRSSQVETLQASADSIEVWDAIRRLPVRQAEVIVLVFCSGLSHAEAAEVMGCTLDTVRTHLKRAKTHLARALGDAS